jgi:hypothetical protein
MRWTTYAVGCGALGLILLPACGGEISDESVGSTALALDVCDETVPENRYVDGLPAYAQCDGVESAAVWSNNGVDTSTASQGSDWVRTQYSGGYQCTEWAYRYMYFRFGVDYRHGNASEWCDGDLPSTLVKSSTPVHGDLIVFDGGSCGAADDTGHIAVIDTVDDSAGKVTFVEQNRAGRRTSDQSCALCFLHAVANDGTSSMGGAGGAGGAPSGAGTNAGGAAGSAGANVGGITGSAGRNSALGGTANAGQPSMTGGRPGSGGSGQGGMATGGNPDGAGSSNRPAPGGASGRNGSSGSAGTPASAGSVNSSAGEGASAERSDDSGADESGCHVGRTPHAGRTAASATLWFLIIAAGLRRRRAHTG